MSTCLYRGKARYVNDYKRKKKRGKKRQTNYTPSISKPLTPTPKQGALKCNLIADNGIFTIQSVVHLPDNSLTSTKSPAELLRDLPETDTLYTGPPFQQLDEEVQSLMEAYLDVRGINTALALFVPEYIDVKEQREYLGWLGRVRGFVE